MERLGKENFEIISPLIDLVNIYGAFPLLIPDIILKKKIQFYHLPRRTIQSAIEELKEQGLIIEKNSLEDTRRKVYFPIQSEWL